MATPAERTETHHSQCNGEGKQEKKTSAELTKYAISSKLHGEK